MLPPLTAPASRLTTPPFALTVAQALKASGTSIAVVTAARAPEGVDGQKIVSTMRDSHAVQIVGGQGILKGKIFRIGHIGYYDIFDIVTALTAVELVLVDMGVNVNRGAAVTSALAAFEQ